MKIARTDNAIRNSVFGLLYKAQSIILPFCIRTAMIYIMGSEYVGLSSLFTSILSFLSLAELGVGSALVFSMYKPIADDDDDTICALLKLYRDIYRYIGLIILAVGLALMPFLKYMVKGGYPADINIYILYGIYLFDTVSSYLMFGYKQSLLTAFQRTDIISKRTMILQIIQNIVQFSVLLLVRNFYAYIIFLPVFTIITNFVNVVVVNKMYPQYRCRGRVSSEIKKSIGKKILALIGNKMNSKVVHTTNTMFISAFLGLAVVGYYGNYYYILNSIIGVMTVLYHSLTAGLGNSLETETQEKNYEDFKVLSFLNAWIVAFCSTSLMCLFQPFIHLWVGKNDENALFPIVVVILMVVYFFVYQIRRIVLTYKDAGGIWWEDRFRPYISMIVNVALCFALTPWLGVSGVLLATIVSMLVSVPLETRTIYKTLFGRSAWHYYPLLLKYTVVTALVCGATYLCCCFLPWGIGWFFLRMAICTVVPNALFLLINCRSRELKRSFRIMNDRVLKKVTKRFQRHGKGDKQCSENTGE